MLVNRRKAAPVRTNVTGTSDSKTIHPIRCLGLQDDEDVKWMLKGSNMVKGCGRTPAFPEKFKLQDLNPSHQNFSITEVECVCEGCHSKKLRQMVGAVPEGRCLTVVFKGPRKNLDLLCQNNEEAFHWTRGIRTLQDRIGNMTHKEKLDHWIHAYLTRGDKNCDDKMSYNEVQTLLQMINIDLSDQYARKLFQKCDHSADGRLDHAEIEVFCRELLRRPELDAIFFIYSTNECFLSTADLRDFLNDQGEDSSFTHAQSLILTYELNEWAQRNHLMTPNGFTMYMLSKENSLFNPNHVWVYQNMKQPLAHYFISSSHNTFLTKDQLTGESGVEPYIRALNHGCRCVELDCWDGDKGQPVIYHGYTLTSKVPFVDVIDTINKYAFKASPYPLILSLENHCSLEQQTVMAQHLQSILGDKLLTKAIPGLDSNILPSPEPKCRLVALLDIARTLGRMDLPLSFQETRFVMKNGLHGCKGRELRGFQMTVDGRMRRRPSRASWTTTKRLTREASGRNPDQMSQPPHLLPLNAEEYSLSPSWMTEVLTLSLRESTDTLRSKVILATCIQDLVLSNLKGKILVKGKRENTMEECMSSLSDLSSSDEPAVSKMCPELSELIVYTRSVHFESFQHASKAPPTHMSSFTESEALRHVKDSGMYFVRHNSQHLSRIYPSGQRLQSSNYNPQEMWNGGCQLVALNFQTPGEEMDLNRGKFLQNGQCGYILKPSFMCQPCTTFNPENVGGGPGHASVLLTVRVISAQQLPKPERSKPKDIVDPQVWVEIHGVPIDNKKKKTHHIQNNATYPHEGRGIERWDRLQHPLDLSFNPLWDCTFNFTIHSPGLALIRFVVEDHDYTSSNDFLGQYTLPFTSLRTGYRHVHLLKQDGSRLSPSSLFIQVEIVDCQNSPSKSSEVHLKPARSNAIL
ncbi:1-phosphatidylinositol 4,5-bisphosphate phosphodiesterase delta-3-A-like isoform X3 [Syngnathoides biaculeatus]|uniref:1-phosphatidylinositol 4,5-bisphosphate phosphodiesterase delta-3-A-like isoform X3 n=1 Tax=Syngnathoides biaculeatus TaxID=300417 RepID=UPI002ADE326E|nr:1-phosphatidylinositol 4,5-bisphosphate phosphodiesterase delta-3-A-like isoform X3 [Syngnathoides biaculeatus]